MAQASPGPGGDSPNTPMEEGDPLLRSAKKQRPMKRSFADAVASINIPAVEVPSRVEANEWAFEDIDVEFDTEPDADKLVDGRPRVTFSKELRKELCSAWKMALIIKYLGKNIHCNVLNQRLPTMWNLQGKMTLIDIGYGYFVARFDSKIDYLHVLLDGPWKIFDNYLVTQRWEPEFRPRTAKLSKMAVWVRLPDLPMEYFRDDTIRAILDNVGKSLKLDRTTSVATKGRFARAAVEVDLNKPLVSDVLVGNSVQLVEYESLHVVCFNCGVVGHREQSCPEIKSAETEVPNMDINGDSSPEADAARQPETPTPAPMAQPRPKYGTLMLVTKKAKPPAAVNNSRNTRKDSSVSAARGNQFSILSNINDMGRTATRSNNTDKRKSKPGPKSGLKGKSLLPVNSPQAAAPPSQPVTTTVLPENSRSTNPDSRGRGGQTTVNRGKGRKAGQNSSASHINSPLDSTATLWNRGIVNGRVRKHVKQLLTTSRVDAFCLLEIRSSRADKMIDLAHNLGYNNRFLVDPIGFAGGLLLFWKQGHIDLDVISHNSQAIHAKVNRRPVLGLLQIAGIYYTRAMDGPWVDTSGVGSLAPVMETNTISPN
ncbi:uncharacterized protein LOC116015991 [Ipomoea triloba]|uniref:uncharacterized protein LOC116015991 n=1 Tax=Ipomoea triloba TaxID=35885 RepID=UPI00125CEB31|nr:uncharacterized protein LOC116015991 [Ipomoea triloba]